MSLRCSALFPLVLAASIGFAPFEPAHAQAPEIPAVVKQGLDSLVAGNRVAAVSLWGRAWTGADTSQAVTLLNSLDQVGELLGQPQGYDLVQQFDVGPNVRHVYIVVRYNKQPLYAYFVAYRPMRDWQVVSVLWNTDPTKVFPNSLLVPPQ